MGQKCSSLEYGNGRVNKCANADVMFYWCKSKFPEKNLVLPIEKFLFLVFARNKTMLQHRIQGSKLTFFIQEPAGN